MSSLRDDHLDQPTEAFQLLQPEPPAASSPLAALKAVLHDKASGKYAWIAVPETDGMLVVKYRWLSAEQTDKLTAKARQAARGLLAQQRQLGIDVLIDACEAVCLRDPRSDGEPVPIDEDGLGPCRYDERLCEALELNAIAETLGFAPIQGAFDTVRAVFHGNDQAIAEHSQRLQRWFLDRKTEADREFWEPA